MLPEPESSVHAPVPTPAFVAESVADAEQIVWLLPALAVGWISLMIFTAEVAEGQLPLLTVHKKVLVPVFNEVTCDE